MLRKTSLNSGWRFAADSWLPLPKRLGFSALEWLPAAVPGHVHADLVRAQVIADPLTLKHELGCQWVDEEQWHYETQFAFAPDASLPRRVLRFEGLDTVCTVLLNGEVIAEHDNMFVPLEVDVSERLAEGDNVLRVHFRSAAQVGRERRRQYLEAEGLSLEMDRFDERAFVRKAQYMYGWDWGPRLISAGLWRPVTLLEYQARLTDVHVVQKHNSDGSVELTVTSEVTGDATVTHALQIDGFRRVFRDGQTLRIDKPELWWPVGMGEPKLYTLTSVLTAPGDTTSLVEWEALKPLDQRQQRIGLRRVELEQKPDEHGTSFGFVVNGRPLWTLGANWIPDHSFPSLVDRDRVFAQVERAQKIGMNMLRVWGGGLYETDEFYDACDELGVLVWQDFPFACNYAPDDEAAQEVMRKEASSEVRRLRNRASLCIWCGNNENLVMFETKWGNKETQPPRYYGENIWNGTLPALLADMDPSRPYVASSPIGGPAANADEAGDQHNWDVWHGRGDWVHYAESRGRFISEFGFASAPGRKAWQVALPARASNGNDQGPDWAALDVGHPMARWHDKTAKGYDTFIGYVEFHYGAAKNLEEWTYTSQLNQRDALRFALEHYRGHEFCRGTLIWQLNDCWPVQSWALLDSEAVYKAAAFELRRLFAPALCALLVSGDKAKVVVALDNVADPQVLPLAVVLRTLDGGSVLQSYEHTVELRPGQRRTAMELDLSAIDRRRTSVTTTLGGVSSTRLLCEPKELELPAVPLRVRLTEDILTVEADVPVFDLFLDSNDDRVQFLDNFLSLPAPGKLTFRIRGASNQLRARSLAGEHPIRLHR